MDFGLLILRLAVGATTAAHGTQKLLPPTRAGTGLDATAGFVDRLGFRPARAHAWLLALSELAGGVALAAGLVTPIAAAAVIGVMTAAIAAVHLPKGFFAQAGGIELPLLIGLGALAIAFTGSGNWSVDHALGWHLTGDRWALVAAVLGLAAAAATLAARRLRVPWTGGPPPAPA